MNSFVLLKRNLAHFRRTNLAVVCGVAVAVAVLAGALLVGDSVRASLRELFLQRLGNTEQVLSGASFFREQLASEIEQDGRFHGDACPLIVLSGTVTHEASKRWSSGVQVYGVDERFWQFHGKENSLAPRERELLVGASLADELGVAEGDHVLLRVEKPSAIPVESLHGRKEDLGRTVRLNVRARLDAAALGDFSLHPQQTAVKVVFVPLALLQRELEQEGKVNTILLSGRTNDDALRAVVKERVTLEDLGVRLRALDEGRVLSLETESALVNNYLAETATATAGGLGLRPQPVFSYLANSIRSGPREVPYSLVTALDDESFDKLKSTSPSSSQAASALPPIVLNEWAARELDVQTGAPVTLEYYLWHEGGRLTTATAEFQLAGVVPIQGLAADRNLVPEYPGITGSESLSDWDPPFPVDLARVRDSDEKYWDQYRTTPKAFIPLARGQELWPSRFGKLTSLRLQPTPADAPTDATLDAYRSALRAALDPVRAGLTLYAAREEGLKVSQGATNFGEYFLYFSFFLVVSALMLAALFFKLGVEQRLRELGILRAVGFHAARIRTLFLVEGIVLATAGSVVGLAGALVYGKLMMLGLTTRWVGAVGTTLLKLHVSPLSLMLGGAGGVLAALLCIYWTLRRLAPASPRSLLTGSALADAAWGRSTTRARRPYTLIAAVVSTVAALALLLGAALGRVGQVAGFFGGGALLLIALLCYQSVWLRRRQRRLLGGSGWWSVARLGFRNVAHRPVRSVLCIALIASAAFIIVAVESFRREGRDATLDRKSGGGGYPLLAESALPLVHDPNTPEGREALNLNTGQDAAALEGIRFARFRLRPGDDASCLNLYQPRNPRILAPTEEFVREGRFSFQNSLARTREEQENPWLLLDSELDNGAVPVMADANSLSYVLHLKLGDEFRLEREGGSPVRLRVVGALSDSIFQSELLMSEKNFLRLFPEQEGFQFFLLDLPQPETAAAQAKALETQLSDFGFDVSSTAERLAQFHRVENTFISTFQMLGALGLALGTLGMAAVLLRNVLERRRELALLRAVGYNAKHFALMVVAENALLLVCGLLTGTACALLAIAPVFFSRGGGLPNFNIGLLLLCVLISGLLASLVATAAALRSPLIPALRSE
ncbi:MAG TPA: ABC transporter permease [Pyrinomonadaceae bacterium]|nr:ABC transporter permease [Pyrinomonadaceae bacterium]